MFAYIWLYICLELWTDKVISLEEAIITFSFFWILLILAFVADKIKQWKDRKNRNKLAQFNIEDFYVILNARNNNQMEESENGVMGNDNEGNKNHKELQKYLKEVFNKENIEDIKTEDVEEVLKPKSVVGERLKYRKNIGSMISGKKKVTVSKGEKHIEELKLAQEEFQKHELNPKVGFRCLHYSTTESAGMVRIVVCNKNEEEKVSCGIRTVDGTANAGVGDDPGDYEFLDETINIPAGMSEISVPIRIIDDEGIEPDEDFYVELYDLKTKERLLGEDTKTTVTILDDDNPGIFGFEMRTVKVRAKDEKIRLRVLRADGCDDDVVVSYKTFVPDCLSNPAQPTVDYMPVEGQLTFESGETMQAINVAILQREDKDSSERDDVFSVKLFDLKFALEKKNQIENVKKPRLGK
jgi:solute carrier family 8 (sodium/calcium exchanger)